jgi:stearoyl-CoA desaturase (delta-9 desaturase)
MIWIPLFAAGIINGAGHYWGYRNFACADASTNIVPWGIMIGGEELHNNHHAYGSSARLSSKWYEFDIGWLYIRILGGLGLARVKKVAPRVRFSGAKALCDSGTLQAVITHRYDVMTRFSRSVRRLCKAEIRKLETRTPLLNDSGAVKAMRAWLHRDAGMLQEQERAKLKEVLAMSLALQTVYTMRTELAVLWERSAASKEQLLRQLEDWCRRAEASGIVALQEFSRKLRCYA